MWRRISGKSTGSAARLSVRRWPTLCWRSCNRINEPHPKPRIARSPAAPGRLLSRLEPALALTATRDPAYKIPAYRVSRGAQRSSGSMSLQTATALDHADPVRSALFRANCSHTRPVDVRAKRVSILGYASRPYATPARATVCVGRRGATTPSLRSRPSVPAVCRRSYSRSRGRRSPSGCSSPWLPASAHRRSRAVSGP